MKRILGLVFTLIYLFTSSSLVHANTMGIFHIGHTDHHNIAHCHQDTPSTSQKKTTQTMNCCELFSSNQYFQAKLELTNSIKFLQNTPIHVYPIYYTYISQKPYKHMIAFSPGGQTSLGKYNKFSDLSAGIIVSLS